MECNKDEATRAKVIAETKLSSKDYSGAKKFALKAKSLYPELDGISEMMTILDVYTSAENKIQGESDWYGILGVTPYADDETIRKAYRKMALALHPDKNKSVAADGAFKYVSEAWSLLSDKAKRSAYNQKRNVRVVPNKASSQTAAPSAPFRSNDFHKYAGRSTTNVTGNHTTNVTGNHTTNVTGNHTTNVTGNHTTNIWGNHSSTSRPGVRVAAQRKNTFWTICNGCKTHFEYLRVYENQNLLCPNCKVAFLAVERIGPETAMPVHLSPNQHVQSSLHNSTGNVTVHSGRDSISGKRHVSSSLDPNLMKKHRQDPPSGMPNYVGAPKPHTPAFSHPSMDREKRFKHETNPSARSEARNVQMKLNSDYSSLFYTPNTNATAGNESHVKGGINVGSFSNVHISERTKLVYGYRESPAVGVRALLIKKASTEILKKLSEWSLATKAKTDDRVNLKTKDGRKETLLSNPNNGSKHPSKINLPDIETKEQKVDIPSPPVDDLDGDGMEQVSMTVPDPDFHNFDMDRTEKSFGENEVWASYDNDDGMPRFYALIHQVISINPFKLKISWLNSKSSSEFGSSDWVDCGFSKTCGIFRIGRHETTPSLNSFSHKVEWTRVRGAVHIYPKKGDVWALYKNWSSDWDENTPDEIIHKYEMVELVDDYNEEQGVSVVPLVKVPGFKTVFRPDADPNGVTKIVKEEMFRFSHQVPYYIITGKEAENAPKGCRELDPAATPVEFLQVGSET